MQKLSIVVFLLIGSLASAQNRETVNVEPFNRISFGVSGNAYVKQGSTQRVEIEGNKETLEKIEVKVEGGKLVIRSKDRWGSWSWGKEDRISVYITAKDIRGLSVSGSGDMETQTKIVTGDLDLKVSGSGSLKAEVEANNLDASVSGSGRIKLRGKCNNMESGISGSGDVEADIAIANKLDVSISGSGKLIATGKANNVKTSISGSGSIRAAEFEVESADIKIAGSGSVEINVKSELNANISGSGSVRYKGNPNHVNANSSGSGKVRKIS
ncbi:MAG TPA: head GIN domain-containing protein [Cyclobacteriaceae bacterium]|nr:head GIN domain-containing protein [Cyclobacteriaceae bacterium]HRJ80794.1 head GIN domain-containing protein [Cyclobacteriaceae bacterium]